VHKIKMSTQIILIFNQTCMKLLDAFKKYIESYTAAVLAKTSLNDSFRDVAACCEIQKKHVDVQLCLSSNLTIEAKLLSDLSEIQKELRDERKLDERKLDDKLKRKIPQIYINNPNFNFIDADMIIHESYLQSTPSIKIEISLFTHLILINKNTFEGPQKFKTPLRDEHLYEIHCIRCRIARFEFFNSGSTYVIDSPDIGYTTAENSNLLYLEMNTSDGNSKIILNIEKEYTTSPWAISETYQCHFGTVNFNSFYCESIQPHFSFPQVFMSYGRGQCNFIENFCLNHARQLLFSGTVVAQILLGAPPFLADFFESTEIKYENIGGKGIISSWNFFKEFATEYNSMRKVFMAKVKDFSEEDLVSVVKFEFRSEKLKNSLITLINLPYNNKTVSEKNKPTTLINEMFTKLYYHLTVKKELMYSHFKPSTEIALETKLNSETHTDFTAKKTLFANFSSILSNLNDILVKFHLVCFAENEVCGDQTIAVKSLREVLQFAAVLSNETKYAGGRRTRKKYFKKN